METAVAKLLNGIYRAMPKMGNRAKDKVFTVSLLLLFLMMFADSSGLVPIRMMKGTTILMAAMKNSSGQW